jgi:uncharacterized membrane-anchored protein
MNTLVRLALICALAACPPAAFAQNDSGGLPPDFEQRLGYQTGTVPIGDDLATITLPESFRYIGADASRRLLVDAWGNPPGAADSVLGMLIPANASPLSSEGWGIIITFEEDGYVNDDDAGSLDYAALLKQMQEETVASNEARREEGFEPVTLVGWAEPPSYDAKAHKLYWAKELAFGSDDEHTLNYNIRILGRRGVLVMNAVASMGQLAQIKAESANVLAAVDFNQGHRYADFIPGTDKAAEYGIAGLILGAAATKAGLFKLLIGAIVAFKKVAIAAVIGLLALVKKLYDRRRANVAPPPLPPTESQA